MPSPARPVAYVADPGGLVFRNVHNFDSLALALVLPSSAPWDDAQSVTARLHELRRLGLSVPECVMDHERVTDRATCLLVGMLLRDHFRLEAHIVPSVLARRPDLWATADARIEPTPVETYPVLGKGYTKVVTFA